MLKVTVSLILMNLVNLNVVKQVELLFKAQVYANALKYKTLKQYAMRIAVQLSQ
jgi:hypothetical protein